MICDGPDLTLQAVLADQLRRIRRICLLSFDRCFACVRAPEVTSTAMPGQRRGLSSG